MKVLQTLLFTFIITHLCVAQNSQKASTPLKTKPDGTKIIDTFEDDSLGIFLKNGTTVTEK